MSITLHHLNYSRSLRALWMLEELGLEYTVKQWERDANFRAPLSATEVHPLGRFPMVEVDGLVLAESGAIMEYFADRESALRPSDPEALREYRFFLHYAEGSAMPPLLIQLILQKLREAPLPFFIKPLAKSIAKKMDDGYSGPAVELHFDFIDKTLAGREYFAGAEFSMADIQMFYPVEAALSRGTKTRTHLSAWRDRVTARDAYERAEKAGGLAVPA